MSFSAKHIDTEYKKEEPLQAPLSNPTLTLTKEEIEVLLVMIKDSTFKGEHVEKIYTLVYKLQQYYLALKQ